MMQMNIERVINATGSLLIWLVMVRLCKDNIEVLKDSSQ